MQPAPGRTLANKAWPGLLVAAITIVAHLWTLGLGFTQDDYPLISRVSRNFAPEPWFGSDPCSGEAVWFHEVGHPFPQRFMFRVTAWTLWWLLVHGAGGAVHALVFHGALLLIHAATMYFLFRLLQRATNTSAAFVACVFFAIEPGSIQAVTWASAAGDLLAVTLLILSALFLQKRRLHGRLRDDVLAGLCFALAAGSKESAVFFGPAVLLGLLSVRPDATRPRAPLWRLVPCFLVPFAILAVARRAYTGEWIPTVPPSRLMKDHATVWEFLGQALAPWQPVSQQPDPLSVGMLRGTLEDGTTTTAIRIIGAVLVLLPCLLGMLVRPRWLGVRLLALLAAGAIGIYPVAIVLLVQGRIIETNAIGRAAHPLFPLIAATIACSLFAARDAARWARIAVIAPLLLWQVDFLVHVARVEIQAADRVRKLVETFTTIVERGPPGARYVAIDPVYSLGVGIEHAFRPPFYPKTFAVTWLPRATYDVVSRVPCLRDHPGPVVFAEIVDGAFVASPTIPAIPDPMPALEKAEETANATRFRFQSPVALRAVGAFRVRVKPADGTGRIAWKAELEGGAPAASGWLALPEDAFTTVLLDPGVEPAEWPLDAQRRRVTGLELAGASVEGVPVAIRRLPEIVLSAPPSAEGGELPPLRWTTVEGAASHEIEVRLRLGGPSDLAAGLIRPVESTIAEAAPLARRLAFDPGLGVIALDLGGDALRRASSVWTLEPPRRKRRSERPTLPWKDIAAGIVMEARAKDIHCVPFEFRVTAYDRFGALAGQSDWRTLYLNMPD